MVTEKKERIESITMAADMVPHGSDFNTLAAAGAFDRGQHARIDCGHCRRLALNVMSR